MRSNNHLRNQVYRLDGHFLVISLVFFIHLVVIHLHLSPSRPSGLNSFRADFHVPVRASVFLFTSNFYTAVVIIGRM